MCNTWYVIVDVSMAEVVLFVVIAAVTMTATEFRTTFPEQDNKVYRIVSHCIKSLVQSLVCLKFETCLSSYHSRSQRLGEGAN